MAGTPDTPQPDQGGESLSEFGAYTRRKNLGSGKAGAYRSLSPREYALYAALFAVLPVACVVVSSVLYYVWKRDHPRMARQINTLGFVNFGLHLAFGCGWMFLLPMVLA